MPSQSVQVVPIVEPFSSRRGRARLVLLLPAVLAVTAPAAGGRAHAAGPLHLAAISMPSAASGAGVRTWTDRTGQYQVEAEFFDYRDGKVRLKKTDGRTISIPLETLSAADREHVRQRAAHPPQPAGTTADAPTAGATGALVELLSGAKSRGRIVARDDKYLTLSITVGSRTYVRKYPLGRIHAVVTGGKREVLNEMTATGSATEPRSATEPSLGARRTRAAIEALIDRVGRTPPDWWDSVPLDYPETLDLAWPQKPPGGWNAQKNVGQYIWDVINPNPGKWRSGVRFLHHLLTVHESHPETRARVMDALARMYFVLLQDYARAAFWWRQAGAERDDQSPRGINLATCYWKLGNKQMAVELLGKLPVYYSSIKLWADMGETRKAVQLAEAGARGDLPDLAYLYAGDACRVAGQYQQALQYYQKVLDVPASGKAKNRIEQNQQRARASIEGIRIFDMLDLGRVADGTYRASSPGYAGPVHVEVTVHGGRIELVKVTGHQEKQFYSALTDTPEKIIEKQGVKGVDATSNATITSEAIINATAKALAGGMK